MNEYLLFVSRRSNCTFIDLFFTPAGFDADGLTSFRAAFVTRQTFAVAVFFVIRCPFVTRAFPLDWRWMFANGSAVRLITN